MSRYHEAEKVLEERRFFKIVCGAGNEDSEEVRKLTTIYTLAGTSAIDISANLDVVAAAVQGIRDAEAKASVLNRRIQHKPWVTVSVGMKGDPHIRKAEIAAAQCTACGACLVECAAQAAITGSFVVIQEKCIGCGKCGEVCPADAITFYDKRVELDDILPGCLNSGAEMLELHAVSEDNAGVLNDWRTIDRLLPDSFISMCLDRSLLSNKRLTEKIREVYAISGKRLIIQADGVPMSGGSDDFNTTLQAIATADIVQKSGIPVKILASGGTNSKTRELAELCGVTIHGVSIGTFARTLVKRFIERADFDQDLDLLKRAVSAAETLVKSNIAD